MSLYHNVNVMSWHYVIGRCYVILRFPIIFPFSKSHRRRSHSCPYRQQLWFGLPLWHVERLSESRSSALDFVPYCIIGLNYHTKVSHSVSQYLITVTLYLIYIALLHRFMIISEALYNIHLCKACQCFIPVWRGATPSQINSLGSIQVTWQLYSVSQPRETIHCFCIHLICTYIQYILTLYCSGPMHV